MTDTGPDMTESAEPETLTVQDDVTAITETVADNTPIYLIADVVGPDFLLSRTPDTNSEDTEVWRSTGKEEDTFRLGDIWDHYKPEEVVFYAEAEEYDPENLPGNALDDGPIEPPPESDVPDYITEGTIVPSAEEIEKGVEPGSIPPSEGRDEGEVDQTAVVANVTGDPIADLQHAREQQALAHLRQVVEDTEAMVAAEIVRRTTGGDVSIGSPEASRGRHTIAAAAKTPSDDDDDSDPAAGLSEEDIAQADLDGDGEVSDEEAAAYEAQIQALEDEIAAMDAEEAMTAEMDPDVEVDPDAPDAVDGEPVDPAVESLSNTLFGAPEVQDGEIDPYMIIERAATGDPAAMQSVIEGFKLAYDDDILTEDFIKKVLPPRPEGPMSLVEAWDLIREEAKLWLPVYTFEKNIDMRTQTKTMPNRPSVDMATAPASPQGAEVKVGVDEDPEAVTAGSNSAAWSRSRSRRRRGGRNLSHEEYMQRVNAAKKSAEARRKNKASGDGEGDGEGGGGGKKGKKLTQKERRNRETGKLLKTLQRHSLDESKVNNDGKGRVSGKSIGLHVGMLNALNEAGWKVTTMPDGSGTAVSPEGQKLTLDAPKRAQRGRANPWMPGQGTFGPNGEYRNWAALAEAQRKRLRKLYGNNY